MTESNCVFCGIVAGDIPGTIVAETERAIAFMDINPGTRGHLLVVPRTHTEDLTTISPEDLTAVVLLGQQLAIRVKERLGADGVNLVQSNGAAAWQTVFHFHLHVIPRYEGDPLVLPWRPEPGNPDEISEAAKLLGG